MDKLLSFLRSLPLVWRIIVVIALAVIIVAATMSSCVMINSSLRGEVSSPRLDSVVHYTDTTVSF